MARIRTIKPDFWTSESLATRLPGPDGRQARLLFIALWNHAEDHGVCRASPALLRSQAFPYDEDVSAADVGRWMELLEKGRFIVRYDRNGSAYAWVRGFDEHQRIDRKSKTTLPEPSREEIETSNRPAGETIAAVASPRRALDEPSLQEGKGREGKGEEETALSAAAALQVPLLQVTSPEERPEDLQALWNVEAHSSLPRWQGMSDARKRRAAARLRERPLQSWRDVIRRLSASPFCRGEEGNTGWRASPDWLLQPDVADKVLEGKYDRPGSSAATPATPRPKMRVL